MAPPICVALHSGHVAQLGEAATSPREILNADPAEVGRAVRLSALVISSCESGIGPSGR